MEREENIILKVSKEEKEKIKETAKKLGLNMSNYIRLVSLKGEWKNGGNIGEYKLGPAIR